MKNMQIAGTGNSRFMKSAISETATWEEFRDMLRAGTFAFDFNGINEAGITEKGTPYDVDSVLKDSTAALLGGDANMVPDEALVALKNLIDSLTAEKVGAAMVASGSYTGTGKYGASNPCKLTFGFDPKFVAVCMYTDRPYYFIWVKGLAKTASFNIYASGLSKVGDITFNLSGNTFSWYSNDALGQLNASGKTCNYVSVG